MQVSGERGRGSGELKDGFGEPVRGRAGEPTRLERDKGRQEQDGRKCP